MKILVINAGSSSLKFQLIDMDGEKLLCKGLCDRIGIDGSVLKYKKSGADEVVKQKEMKDHKDAVAMVISALTDKENGVISDMSEIGGVGHRVVHGGESFHDSALITDDVMKTLYACIDIAPLHNPPNITGIESCKAVMPNTPMVAVFDTAFHQSMPKYAYLYALPYEMYEKHGIRKYGFHGTSHKYVSERAAQMLGKPIEQTKIVTCHLGNGASVCAVSEGKSVETSMGFTPLAGLAMGTRSGTIDPAVVSYLMDKEKMSFKEINDYLNKKSGVLGISGVSSDFRDIEAAANEGNERAKLALKIFSYRVKKYIGEYSAAMDGVDAVVFTAGIGENNPMIREMALSGLEYMGIKVDKEKNQVRGQDIDISTADSKVKVFVIATNEELVIARDTKKLISGK